MPNLQDIGNINSIDNQNNKTNTNKKIIEALNKYFKLIVILVGVIVLYIGYYFVIIPKWELKSDKDIAMTALQSEVDKLKMDSDFLSKYSSKIIEFSPEEERKLNLALPSSFDLPSIVVQLSQLASEHKFIVESINANETAVNGLNYKNIKRVDIEMTVLGTSGNDYGSFGRFISAVESSLLIFDVRAISFSPDEAGYKLELSTYYYPNK